MEYIDAPTVEAKCGDDESAKEKMYFEVGKILHEMHKPKSTGFGKAIDGKGEFASFKEWVDSADMAKRIKYVEDNNLINSELGNFAEARDVLVNFVGDSDMSSYCHFDYGAKHLFATEPLTVFDPNPLFNIGYIDLGRTLVNYIGASGTYPKQLVEGYGGADGFDEKVLRASIFLNIVYKMRYQHQKGKKEVVQNFKNYLANNKSFSV